MPRMLKSRGSFQQSKFHRKTYILRIQHHQTEAYLSIFREITVIVSPRSRSLIAKRSNTYQRYTTQHVPPVTRKLLQKE